MAGTGNLFDLASEKMEIDPESVRYLVYSSGGLCGWAFVGSDRALDEWLHGKGASPMSTRLRGACGVSVGSIFALGRVTGYTSVELEEMFRRHTKQANIKIHGSTMSDLLTALLSPRPLVDLVEDMLVRKYGEEMREATLTDLWRRTNKEFVTISTNRTLGYRRTVVSHLTFPEIKVSTAVVMSAAFPMIYPPINVDGQLYVDGGVSDSTPTDIFPMAESIVFTLATPPEIKTIEEDLNESAIASIWSMRQPLLEKPLVERLKSFTPAQIRRINKVDVPPFSVLMFFDPPHNSYVDDMIKQGLFTTRLFLDSGRWAVAQAIYLLLTGRTALPAAP